MNFTSHARGLMIGRAAIRNPWIFQQIRQDRLRKEDEELLIDIERKYAGRLTFRSDPTYHHEKFSITDANTGAELKA
jgi:tRNA-dihydrouridine synthase